jgi:pilus assembly protein Flp/PilA
MIRQFLRDERGATAIEYALIASLIGMVIIGAVTAIGGALSGTFTDAAAGLN